MARSWLQGDTSLPEVCKILGDMDVRMGMKAGTGTARCAARGDEQLGVYRADGQ